METSPASWLQNFTHFRSSSKPLPALSLQERGFYACSLLSHWIFHINTAFFSPNRHCWLSHGNVLTFMAPCSLYLSSSMVCLHSSCCRFPVLLITRSFSLFQYCLFPPRYQRSAFPWFHFWFSFSLIPLLCLSLKQVLVFCLSVFNINHLKSNPQAHWEKHWCYLMWRCWQKPKR